MRTLTRWWRRRRPACPPRWTPGRVPDSDTIPVPGVPTIRDLLATPRDPAREMTTVLHLPLLTPGQAWRSRSVR